MISVAMWLSYALAGVAVVLVLHGARMRRHQSRACHCELVHQDNSDHNIALSVAEG